MRPQCAQPVSAKTPAHLARHVYPSTTTGCISVPATRRAIAQQLRRSGKHLHQRLPPKLRQIHLHPVPQLTRNLLIHRHRRHLRQQRSRMRQQPQQSPPHPPPSPSAPRPSSHPPARTAPPASSAARQMRSAPRHLPQLVRHRPHISARRHMQSETQPAHSPRQTPVSSKS